MDHFYLEREARYRLEQIQTEAAERCRVRRARSSDGLVEPAGFIGEAGVAALVALTDLFGSRPTAARQECASCA